MAESTRQGQSTRQQWRDWAQHELGGSAAQLDAATEAALAALARGETPEQAAAAARASTANGAAALGGDEASNRRELLARIRSRRASVHEFVAALKPRGARLTTISMGCSGAVTLLTAGPAFGGPKFTEVAQRTFGLPSEAFVWQFLCFAAVLASIGAAVATNLYKQHDMGARLLKAETSQAVLEGLEVLVEFGQIPVVEGVKLYQQAIAEIPFIPERAAHAR